MVLTAIKNTACVFNLTILPILNDILFMKATCKYAMCKEDISVREMGNNDL